MEVQGKLVMLLLSQPPGPTPPLIDITHLCRGCLSFLRLLGWRICSYFLQQPHHSCPEQALTWPAFKVGAEITPLLQVGNEERQGPVLESGEARTQTWTTWGRSAFGLLFPRAVLFSNSASHPVVFPKLAWCVRIIQVPSYKYGFPGFLPRGSLLIGLRGRCGNLYFLLLFILVPLKKLEYSWFTMLSLLLVCSKVIQFFICIFIFRFFSIIVYYKIWIQFPVLYSRTLLFIYFICSSVYLLFPGCTKILRECYST